MAGIESNELEMLGALVSGDYITERRMMLEITVDNGGKKTVFDLKFTAGGDSADTYEAFFGGKELDIAKFKAYYQSIIAISPIAYDTGAKGTPEATLTFVHTENLGDTVLSFRKYSAQRYQVDINGIPLGIITKTAFDNLITATYNTAEGK